MNANGMKSSAVTFALCLGAAFTTECFAAERSGPQSAIHTLSNGMKVVIVHFPKSTNVSIFSFLPMSLCADPPERAQWSHLVEHMVVRSTLPDDLSRGNAETLPDHMRLDFYGTTADWKDALSHHRRWLEGVPFIETTLAAEKPKVIAECDFTSRNSATHKFALAAWSHARRHSNSHVAIKADVLRAALPDVQRYRDEFLFVPERTTICAVGAITPEVFLPEIAKQLGDLRSTARLTPATPGRTGNLEVTWDLDARHLLLLWPLPAFTHEDFPPMLAAAASLNMRLFMDQPLRQSAPQTFAGADLTTPEGNFFFISAGLRPEAKFGDVEKLLRGHLHALDTNTMDSTDVRMLGQQLASSLTDIPDPARLMGQVPPGITTSMLEGNIGLAFAMNVHRYGPHRETLSRKCQSITSADIQRVTTKYLAATNATTCAISAQAK